MRETLRHILIILIAISASCSDKQTEQPLFTLMQNTGVNFVNAVEDQEINNSFLFRNFYNGGGVGIGDINNDGLADILLTSNMGENKLYLNKGNWQFEDITTNSGLRQDSMWSTGIVMVDINNDGWLDMYVCNSGNMENGNRKNKLYINSKNLSFTESAAAYGLDISCYATQASFFDYDLDGDLDCFIIANSPMPVNTLGYSNRRELAAKDWPVEPFVRDGGDHLYRNDNGKFVEVTKAAGIHGTLISFGLGVSVGDINNDGYPDIYVANDSYERDYLYVNQQNGTFKDELETCMQQTSFSSMGADVADINNDGFADIFTTDMLPEGDYRLKTLGAFDNVDVYNTKLKLGFYHQYMKNCLQLNNGNGTFSEIANYSGVSATDWSWGALIFDADNDGCNDLFVCNGVNKDVTNLDFMNFFANDVIQKMVLTGKKDKVDEVLKHIPVTPVANKTYRNAGGLRFEDVSDKWGLGHLSFSNGAAYADLDNDGDLDLVINNENQPSFLYRNNTTERNKHHSIIVDLRGDSLNTFAIGSKLHLYNGDSLFYRELIPSRGFQSSVDYKQVIGIGALTKIDSLVITWPDLSTTLISDPPIDSLLSISKSGQAIRPPQQASRQQKTPQQSAAAQQPAIATPARYLFDSIPSSFDRHQEDDHIDFYYERNIPQMLSREGPRGAAADVNGDGVTDVYIGGAKGFPGQLYLQKANGAFIKSEQKIFYQFTAFEDAAAIFFDADNDGDMDLYVGAAGNSEPEFSREMQGRILINDGKGNFSLKSDALPTAGVNAGAVVAADFDGDGDTDLFIGGRSVSKSYGSDAASYVMMNDGTGKFSIHKQENDPLAHPGMITAAAWADITGDGKNELIITGEWMAPKAFGLNNGKFEAIKTGLENLNGWWQSLAVADLNNDGKNDIILGNIGENFYLHPTVEHPVKLWIKDFDGNGEVDKVLTRKTDGKDKPVFLKNDIQDQVPGIKKENLRHHDFALKSIQELFGEQQTSQAITKEFNFPGSIVAINKGGGTFEPQRLPDRAQLSSINAIVVTDINNDGLPDIISGGNRSGFPPQLQKLDASFGDVFINKGSGEFQWIGNRESNLNIEGEVKQILEVGDKENKYLLFLRNDRFPVIYRQHEASKD